MKMKITDIYELIKEKRHNALKDQISKNNLSIDNPYIRELKGEIDAYDDVILLIENSGLLKEIDTSNTSTVLEDIEKEFGIEVPLFFKIMKAETLWWKDKNKKYTHNIASEFISVKPYLSIGAGIVFEFAWNDRNIYNYENCDVIIKEQESPIGMPHIYLYLKASEYGKTWALTKEELL